MRTIICLIAIAGMVFGASNCFAAIAGNTADPSSPRGDGVANLKASGIGPIKVSLQADGIIERDLEEESGVSSPQLQGQWYLTRIGYNLWDTVEPYVTVGVGSFKASWKERNQDINTKGEITLAGGAGIKVLIYEMPDTGLRLSTNAQFLYMSPDIDEAKVDVPNRAITAGEFSIKEWQIAFLIGKEFVLNQNLRRSTEAFSLTPYAGLAYADSSVEAKFTFSNIDYSIKDPGADKKFLFIGGLDVTAPGNNVALNVEGRLIGETAASGGCTVKF